MESQIFTPNQSHPGKLFQHTARMLIDQLGLLVWALVVGSFHSLVLGWFYPYYAPFLFWRASIFSNYVWYGVGLFLCLAMLASLWAISMGFGMMIIKKHLHNSMNLTAKDMMRSFRSFWVKALEMVLTSWIFFMILSQAMQYLGYWSSSYLWLIEIGGWIGSFFFVFWLVWNTRGDMPALYKQAMQDISFEKALQESQSITDNMSGSSIHHIWFSLLLFTVPFFLRFCSWILQFSVEDLLYHWFVKVWVLGLMQLIYLFFSTGNTLYLISSTSIRSDY